MMVRWSGERQVNLNLSLTLVDVKLVHDKIRDGLNVDGSFLDFSSLEQHCQCHRPLSGHSSFV